MFANFLLAALPLVPAALAGTMQYPTVIPGPGLPSLESLGLTSELLYKMEPTTPKVDARDALAANYVAKCDSDPAAYVAKGDLQACLNYLNAIGSRDCTVPGDMRPIRYCVAGQADVNGLSITGVVQTTRCSAVAHAVNYVLQSCVRDQKAAGSEAAFNNGDVIVSSLVTGFACRS
ncbi:hypothetical protein LMH87_012209 [Akanthomyces muscarius]|uniref:Secreted protein n=2 Tax=Akanthomyces TaxID=150366 RepID=A0A168J729_CORDF|nr:hypothetical protein LMH87_012209 [Akanthomyces muscarius]KAJ4151516.1 hypothetical protein LMH87_012209 [Akanthomyces muscarius]OAA80084.1 hypothetical protein LEL_03570 [Akanthomyces lecanii RCEF 1005]